MLQERSRRSVRGVIMAKSKKAVNFRSLAQRTRSASQGLSSQDDDLQKQKSTLPPSSTQEVSLREIRARPQGDTRVTHPMHTIELALSIEAVGLIEPLVVDRDLHLLAGGHRLAALRLLSTMGRSHILEELRESGAMTVAQREHFELLVTQLPKPTRLNLSNVPVRVFDFSARDDANKALEVETAENTLRRDYTAKELLELYERLLALGYEDVRGRPTPQQRPIKPALALIIGQSLRTVQRKLKTARDDVERDQLTEDSAKLRASLKRFVRSISAMSDEVRDHRKSTPEGRALIADVKRSAKGL